MKERQEICKCAIRIWETRESSSEVSHTRCFRFVVIRVIKETKKKKKREKERKTQEGALTIKTIDDKRDYPSIRGL